MSVFVYQVQLPNDALWLAGCSLNAVIAAANSYLPSEMKLFVSAASLLVRGKYKGDRHKGCVITKHSANDYVLPSNTIWVPHMSSVIPNTRPRETVNFIVTIDGTTYFGRTRSKIVRYINSNRPKMLSSDITTSGLKDLEAKKLKTHRGCNNITCTRQLTDVPVGESWVHVD